MSVIWLNSTSNVEEPFFLRLFQNRNGLEISQAHFAAPFRDQAVAPLLIWLKKSST